jgi:hypothetical protein
MEKSFCITIDTEPDCDTRWRRSQPLTFESVTFGVPSILRPLWDRFDILPVYFVSPEVAENADCCRVLKDEIKRGAEIGAHLHSEYIGPQTKYADAAGTHSDEFPCYACSKEIESAKIGNLTSVIEKNLGVRPVSYRAARYGADLDTVRILQELNYKVDSSVTPEIDWSKQGGPNHSNAPKQPYFVSENDLYSPGNLKILEVPISISKKRIFIPGKRWLLYRWLRPTLMTVIEMKMLINEFVRTYENPVLNMMFHSMETLPGKTPFVRSKFQQKLYLNRLEKIIKYLGVNGFENRTLGMVYDEKLREISQENY